GGALVCVGARQPPVLHAVAHAINTALGSACAAVARPVLHETDAGPRSLRQLSEEMRAGRVDTLVITAWNPVYGAPADLNFGKALSQVSYSVYRSLYLDETAERAGWVLPALHPLESWGDAGPRLGIDARAGDQHRSRLPRLGRPIRQHLLAAGAAGPGDEGHLGERGAPRAEHREEARPPAG